MDEASRPMDHLTHIGMAYKLLEECGCDKAASIYSLLPALDREPPHFHRVYGHIISNFPTILSSAMHILAGADIPVAKDAYEYRRIGEDKTHYEKLVNKAATLVNDNTILNPSKDLVSSGVALISHIWFDTFNNPVQAFLPQSAYPSGQWNFWRDINYIRFRNDFYKDEIISQFREKLFNDDVWRSQKLDPYTLVKSIVIRLGDLSQPGIEYEVVDSKVREYLRFLNCNEYLRPDRELQFCKSLEKRIASLIFECLG